MTKKEHLTSLNILILDDNVKEQQIVASFFKRSLCGRSICMTVVSTLIEAREQLTSQQFDVITLDGVIPSIANGGMGYTLIPFIKSHQKLNPVIIMISNSQSYVNEGIKLGAYCGFTNAQLVDMKLNKKFELVPIDQKDE